MKKDNYTRLENVIQIKEEFKMDNGNLNLGKKNMEERIKTVIHPSSTKMCMKPVLSYEYPIRKKKYFRIRPKIRRVFSGYIRDRLFNRTGEDENILAYNDLCRTLYDLYKLRQTLYDETELREGISKTIDFFNKNKKEGVIMSIYKLVKSEKRDIQEMIDYIEAEDKTSEEYVYTMGLNVEYAMQDMVFTRIMFGKFSSNTRPYYQFIIALDEKLDTADDSLARFELLIKTVTYLLACGCDNKRPEFRFSPPYISISVLIIMLIL